MHLVHHPQLHHRILVVIDGLVIQPQRDIDPSGAQRHDRGDAIAHVEVAARMAGDRNLAASHQLYFGLGHVNRMTVNDIALHQTEIIEPEYRRLSVPPQSGPSAPATAASAYGSSRRRARRLWHAPGARTPRSHHAPSRR